MDASDVRYDWQALGGHVQAAHNAAGTQARELARALAAHGLVTERDGTPEEMEDRLDAVIETVWPTGNALKGYDLHSSLGAHLISKVAFDLVPAGRTGLRREPLQREGLIAALVDHGVDVVTAASLLGDWQQQAEGFRGDTGGLSPSRVAGLVERSLTRSERAHALDQVAVNPRCLNRVAAALNLLAVMRVLLPVLPPDVMGADALVAIVGLVLGRPDRVAQMFEGRAGTLRMKTFVEIAQAQWALHQAEAPELSDDLLSCVPPSDLSAEDREAQTRADTEVIAEAFDDSGEDSREDSDSEDDILEIVEERVDPSSESKVADLGPVRPARWLAEAIEPLEPEQLQAYCDTLAALRTPAARAGGLLGVAPALAPATVPQRPSPPDERVLRSLQARSDAPAGEDEMTERISIDPLLHGHGLEVEDAPFDPLFPPVRGALRAVVAAAEGHAPTDDAVAKAGDLQWVLARAKALALVVQGDLLGAQSAVQGFPEGSAPEGRWAEDRALRFSGRTPEPVSAEEARPMAAALLSDLTQQLARTLAGTV